ncbi:hypothetical protein J1614_007136 [Plenodomus biglobosus]|nr:hypothetical protein J1614_007136 [Plenodomus biglobosus]
MQQSTPQKTLLSRGDLRKQLSSLLALIKAQGLKFEDVVAEEMLDHLPGLTELAEARTYIVELEGREQISQAGISDLLTKLKAKEMELLDQPSNFKSLEIELQQAQRHIQVYKGISDDATKRADRLQKKLDDFQSKQAISDSISSKVEILQAHLHEQVSDYQKLLQKHNQAAEIAEKQREQYQHAFNAQRECLQGIINEKTEALSDATAENARVEAEAQALSDAYTAVINTLEIDHANVSAAVNEKALQLRKKDVIYRSIQTEIEPLKEFSVHASEILEVYRAFAHSLFNPISSTPVRLGQDFTTLLNHMADDLDLYEKAAKDPVSGKAPHALIREYLDTIATKDGLLWDALSDIQADVLNYIARLRPQDPAAVQSPGNFMAQLKKRFSMGHS